MNDFALMDDPIATERAIIRYRKLGAGPPLLCLHGFPQTGRAFRCVAGALADRYTVIAPDLPGYGASRLKRMGPGAMAKRALGDDMRAFMKALGHERFAIAGHDRGGRVAYRLALDHPECVSALIAIDIAPTFEVWSAMNDEAARGAWHWPFLAAPAPIPEEALHATHRTLIGHLLDDWCGQPGGLDHLARAEYVGQYEDFEVCVGSAEDYRAGATIDLAHDRADRAAGRKIAAPTFVPWGRLYGALDGVDVVGVWRRWALDVRAECFEDCGHFLADERPERLAAAIDAFLQETR